MDFEKRNENRLRIGEQNMLKSIGIMAKELADKFNEEKIKDERNVELFFRLIRCLPGVVIVDADCRQENCLIQGVVRMYSKEIIFSLPKDERRSLEIYFCFMVNNLAVLHQEHFTEEELFRGTWPEALKFILDKFKKTVSFRHETENVLADV